jgi:SAM-dependent methyltransferase
LEGVEMRWVAKAALQNVFACFPGGDNLNYVFQHRITKHYPRNETDFLHWINLAAQHCDIFLKYGSVKNLSDATLYEFGTGWDLLIPLAYCAFGVDCQKLVDIRRLVRLELINDVLRRFAASKGKLEASLNRPLRDLGRLPIKSISELEQRFGITYLAPLDARNTGLQPSSIDFVSSTATLEHIPPASIYEILTECRRILKAGGVVSCLVDMVDHFAYFDPHISDYNFLKFSDVTWSLVNNCLVYTNRLRYPDYLRLIKAAGFEVLMESVEKPTPADLATLRRLRLASRFRVAYTLDELGAKRLQFASRKDGEERQISRGLVRGEAKNNCSPSIGCSGLCQSLRATLKNLRFEGAPATQEAEIWNHV